MKRRGERNLPSGGGELGERIRAFDWSRTELGPADEWPASLRSALGIMLGSRYPMFLWWGKSLVNFYNDAYIPVLGKRHPDALGRPAREVWSEIWDILGPQTEIVLKTGQATWNDRQLLVMERNGYVEETYFSWSYSPATDESGTVSGVFCACTEDTERVLSERRLQTLSRLGATVDEISGPRVACAAAARQLEANPHDLPFAAIYLLEDGGERARFAAGVRVDAYPDLFPAELPADSRLWPFRAAAESARAQAVDELSRRKRIASAPWPEAVDQALVLPMATTGGRLAGFLIAGVSARRVLDAAYRDFLELVAGHIAKTVAAARAYEDEKRRAEALAELDRAKTAFFSNVSHEFRTPLTLMLGPVEDGLADREAPLPPAQRERLELARRNGLRLQRLVNALLDFSRIEAGRAQASYAPTDLAALTADLASSFRSAVEKAGMRLAVDCPPLAAPAYVDRQMWEKIVLNLVSNAFKFTFEGEISVSLRQAAGRAVLAVSDTGTGIAADELPHVFERFRRVEGARSRTHEGSGIGLALVRELARLHGGSVSAESRPGEGSTFVVSIPLGKAHLPEERIAAAAAAGPATADAYVEEAMRWLPEAPVLQEPEAAGTPQPRARIVWADDNADMREYVRRLLAPRYEVTAVCDGEQALAAIRASRPDLVLCDVMMPRLDGLGVVRALRADPGTRALPVILLSARAGEESRIEGYDAGANDYVFKPFTARELLARISARLELTRLENSLQAERTWLATLFAQTPMPTAVLRGPELVFEMCNPAYTAVVGGRDVVGKPFFEALPEARGQGYDAQLLQVMRTGVPYVGREMPVRLQRGGALEETYFTYIYAPLRDADGRIERVIAIVNEVTDQVAARRKLEASEERYRAIFDAAGVSIWEEDFTGVKALIDRLKVDGVADFRRYFGEHPEVVREAIRKVKVLDVNDASLRMFGAASRGELMQSLDRVFLPDTEHVFADELAAIAAERRHFEAEQRMRTLQGQEIDVFVTVAFPEHDAPFDRVPVTLTDITARTRAETALRQSEARYRAVVESQTEMVCRFRLDGTIVFANAAYARSRGTTVEALAGGNFWDHIPAEDHAGIRALLDGLAPASPEVTIENRFETVEGTRWTLWRNRALAFDAAGRVTEAQSTGIDITERKRAEEALRDADRRKDEFLAILSHELRNPLAPISNALTLLHQADDDPAIRHQARAVLDRQVRHLIRLVEDLLDVSRIGRGDVGLRKGRVRVEELISSALETSRPRVESGGHALSVTQPDRELAVDGDGVRLAQVVANLVNNAAAYTPHGGRIDIEARKSDGQAVITVRDNGVGMSGEEMASLFGMFQRGDVAKQHPAGFGIGLALSRRLVEMHGGTIEAASEGRGKGACFTVRLPLARQESQSEREAPKPEAPSAAKRILVVDDNRDAADSLGLVLRTLGAEVHVAHDGPAALAEFDACAPAVVLLDIGMPGMNGYDVAREMRSRDPERRAALVALTGWGQEDDRRRAREAGFDHHLVKPAEIEVLQALLTSLR